VKCAMLASHEVHLRRIDLVDNKLPSLLFVSKALRNTEFHVTKRDTDFRIGLGTVGDSSVLHSCTDIRFETDLDANLAVFAEDVAPLVQTDHLVVHPYEWGQIEERKQAERASIERQLRRRFPVALEALNTLRRGCRVALFQQSVSSRVFVNHLQAGQLDKGLDVNDHLDELFASDDTPFLFGAFSDLSLATFTGDADIEYTVSDDSGQSVSGVFRNGYHRLRFIDRLSERQILIQKTIGDGWSLETDALLASFEFLYSDNYRMAVFNAAAVLEYAANHFWKCKYQKLMSGSPEENKQAARLKQLMDKARKPGDDALTRKLRIAIPTFVDTELVDDGTIERCVDAWRMRNTRLAHILKDAPAEITSTEAWSAVSSIHVLVAALLKAL
jgi:hypothetical protein